MECKPQKHEFLINKIVYLKNVLIKKKKVAIWLKPRNELIRAVKSIKCPSFVLKRKMC